MQRYSPGVAACLGRGGTDGPGDGCSANNEAHAIVLSRRLPSLSQEGSVSNGSICAYLAVAEITRDMGTERPADSSSVDMGDSNRRKC